MIGSVIIFKVRAMCQFTSFPQTSVVVVGCPARKDLAVSTRKATEEVAQVEAGPEWEGQRKEESEKSVKPGQVVPTGLAQIVGLDGEGQ